MSGLAIGEAREHRWVLHFRPTCFLAMGLVVQADAEDLVGIGDHRQPRDVGERIGLGLRRSRGDLGKGVGDDH